MGTRIGGSRKRGSQKQCPRQHPVARKPNPTRRVPTTRPRRAQRPSAWSPGTVPGAPLSRGSPRPAPACGLTNTHTRVCCPERDTRLQGVPHAGGSSLAGRHTPRQRSSSTERTLVATMLTSRTKGGSGPCRRPGTLASDYTTYSTSPLSPSPASPTLALALPCAKRFQHLEHPFPVLPGAPPHREAGPSTPVSLPGGRGAVPAYDTVFMLLASGLAPPLARPVATSRSFPLRASDTPSVKWVRPSAGGVAPRRHRRDAQYE